MLSFRYRISALISNPAFILKLQIMLYFVAGFFSFGSTDAASRGGFLRYLAVWHIYVKLAALLVPPFLIFRLYRQKKLPTTFVTNLINRHYYFIWYLIYVSILIPFSQNIPQSTIRITVLWINYIALSSILLQAEIYFGRHARAHFALAAVQVGTLLVFLPLRSIFVYGLDYAMDVPRKAISGFLLHPNSFAQLLYMLLVLAFFLPSFLHGLRLTPREEKQRKFMICVSVVYMIFANARSAIGATILAFGLYILIKNVRKLRLSFIMAALVGSLLVLVCSALVMTEVLDQSVFLSRISRAGTVYVPVAKSVALRETTHTSSPLP